MAALRFAAVALLGIAGAHAGAASDKVQVYIMMGQSNMLGEGRIGTLTTAEPEKEQAELLPQQQAAAAAPAGGAAATCAPQSWWVNVTFSLGRHGAPTKGGKRMPSASAADCCAQAFCLRAHVCDFAIENIRVEALACLKVPQGMSRVASVL